MEAATATDGRRGQARRQMAGESERGGGGSSGSGNGG